MNANREMSELSSPGVQVTNASFLVQNWKLRPKSKRGWPASVVGVLINGQEKSSLPSQCSPAFRAGRDFYST
jgi:hypothetical protein